MLSSFFIKSILFIMSKNDFFSFKSLNIMMKMNKVEVVIMIVDPLSGGHNGNSEDHLPPSVKFLFK